jgi:hypothetical protein
MTELVIEESIRKALVMTELVIEESISYYGISY